MKIFADLHHFDLYYSLHLLFEKRLGYNLFSPYGLDWRQEGYWKISENPIVINGYLDPSKINFVKKNFSTFEGQDEWARYGMELIKRKSCIEVDQGIWDIIDESKDSFIQKGISLERFKQERFDLVISSVPWHFDLYEDLIQKFQPHAKHIFQSGNIWSIPKNVQNLLYSTLPPNVNGDINKVKYHQEFNLFEFIPNQYTNKTINSYVHSLPSEILWNSLSLNEEYQFQFVGKGTGLVDNIIIKTTDLVKSIQSSMFVWHIKLGAEGYGHILFNSAAYGKPLIINLNDYKGTAGGELLEDGKTCIDTTNCSTEELRNKIIYFSDPTRYSQMSQDLYQKFKEIVNFDQEEVCIREFLGKLQ